MWCWNATKCLFCSLRARKTRRPTPSKLARSLWCSLRRQFERGPMPRRPLKRPASRKPSTRSGTTTALGEESSRTRCSTEKVKCAGFATISWLYSTRRSSTLSLSSWVRACSRPSSSRSGTKWTSIRKRNSLTQRASLLRSRVSLRKRKKSHLRLLKERLRWVLRLLKVVTIDSPTRRAVSAHLLSINKRQSRTTLKVIG